ncbi:SDR family oxidoreductase [Ignavibacterium album]|uniref:SDR family oxidoreductase n=1 Tax=Ignavibacterium album TaxID=591197 RepID=UPI0035B7671D
MITVGNTVLITGGSSGIGLALEKRFLAFNNKVIITGRDKAKLEQIKNEFPEITIFAGDLSDENSLVLYVERQHSNLNILINNAAVQYNFNFIDEPNSNHKIDYEISTNSTAPVKLTSLLLPLLLKNKNSAVINVSNGLFIAPKKSASVYCATKSAIHSFSKTLRYQLEEKGIKAFELIPALVETPMTAGRGKLKIAPDELVDEFFKNFILIMLRFILVKLNY